MYEGGQYLYLYATSFICSNALLLILMQLHQYYVRFKEHVNTFEPKQKAEPAPAPAPAPTEQHPPQSIILELKDSPQVQAQV